MQFRHGLERCGGLQGPVERHAEKINPSRAQPGPVNRAGSTDHVGAIAAEQEACGGQMDIRQSGQWQAKGKDQEWQVQDSRQAGGADGQAHGQMGAP